LTLKDRRAVRGAVDVEIDRLDAQIESLTRAFDDIVEAAQEANIDDEHDPEGTTIAFERAQVSALLNQARLDRADLQETRRRIEVDESYGVCTECAEFIGVERLLALPATTTCIRCAR
jgi:RNA polymerase-binding transcription factor DksA